MSVDILFQFMCNWAQRFIFCVCDSAVRCALPLNHVGIATKALLQAWRCSLASREWQNQTKRRYVSLLFIFLFSQWKQESAFVFFSHSHLKYFMYCSLSDKRHSSLWLSHRITSHLYKAHKRNTSNDMVYINASNNQSCTSVTGKRTGGTYQAHTLQ